MRLRHVMCLIAVLPLSMLANAGNSPEMDSALGELQAVAKYCDEITKGEKVDIIDVMTYLSAGTGDKNSCPSCAAMVSEAKHTKNFKAAYESTMRRLAKISQGEATKACKEVQKTQSSKCCEKASHDL